MILVYQRDIKQVKWHSKQLDLFGRDNKGQKQLRMASKTDVR